MAEPESENARQTAVASDADIITVRPPTEAAQTKQRLSYFLGISQETAGSNDLAMNLVMIPPGGAAEPHFHQGYETAIYLLNGRVETAYGVGLEKSVINEEGEFLYIPANVPHRPRNLSETEPALAIVARNDGNQEESVVPYDPAADG